jgi:hypothetical protein
MEQISSFSVGDSPSTIPQGSSARKTTSKGYHSLSPLQAVGILSKPSWMRYKMQSIRPVLPFPSVKG